MVSVGSGATLAPGGSLSRLVFDTNVTLNGGSTTIMEVSKPPLTNDVAQIGGTLTYGGTLVVTNVNGKALAGGDSFKLFDAGSYSGYFANLVPPTPGSGLSWDTAALTNGVLSVVTAMPPRISSIELIRGKLVVTGNGGPARAEYYVLTSTDLALPLNQWTRIATNFFGENGNFDFTNAPGPNLQQAFYLLQLQ
jgi:hypothetical protein